MFNQNMNFGKWILNFNGKNEHKRAWWTRKENMTNFPPPPYDFIMFVWTFFSAHLIYKIDVLNWSLINNLYCKLWESCFIYSIKLWLCSRIVWTERERDSSADRRIYEWKIDIHDSTRIENKLTISSRFISIYLHRIASTNCL